MKSDTIFYRIFKEAPASYFELIGASAATASLYRFSSEEIKHSNLRLDGVFLPLRKGQPVHFVEPYGYRAGNVYSNLLAKVYLWLEMNNPALDWRACVIYPNRRYEPRELAPYRELLESGRIRRVYLDKLPRPAEDQFGLGMLEIVSCPAEETIAKAKHGCGV